MATAKKTRTAIKHEPSAVAKASTNSSKIAEPAVLTSEDDDQVLVVIPKAFNLTQADHNVVRYEAGTKRIPVADAEHWYSKYHGVKPVDA